MSVTQRTDGLYCTTLQVNGKRKYIYGKTPQETRRKAEALKKQVAVQNAIPVAGGKTVNDLLCFWLETVRRSLKPRTVADYEAVIARYIVPTIGYVKLAKLEPGHLQHLYSNIKAQRRAYYVHQTLHRALKLAVLWGWVPFNVADRVIRPSYKPQQKRVWTLEQLGTFLESTQENWLHPLFVFLAVTGCRLGEALGLKWENVEGNTVSIKRTLHRINGRFVETEPKTRSGYRSITLPQEGTTALKRQKVQQAEWRLKAGERWQNTGYVFTSAEGKPLLHSSVEHVMAKCCERLRLPRLSPHGLRHLHASLLLSKGLPLTDVSARLGHANPNITTAIYAHVMPGRDAEAARVMESVLKGGAL